MEANVDLILLEIWKSQKQEISKNFFCVFDWYRKRKNSVWYKEAFISFFRDFLIAISANNLTWLKDFIKKDKFDKKSIYIKYSFNLIDSSFRGKLLAENYLYSFANKGIRNINKKNRDMQQSVVYITLDFFFEKIREMF